MEHTRWFKDKVFYQIWPRSFRDGDGDGIGDLWGVLEKLDYLQELGIDGVWFSPLYPSPGADCGYDISDYMDIAPEYGGMEAFRAVLDGLHQRGMKLIMDLVVNHTSDEHEWFQKSRRRIEPYTDYYIWRPAKKNGKLPNNWDSHFEGKAWQWDDLRQEYYLHLFAVKQPDLNMDNPAFGRTSSRSSPKKRDCRTIICSRCSRASGFTTTARTSTSICRSSAATCWPITTA